MSSQGYVKLHRKLLENPISKKPHYAWLWVTLLLKANHAGEKFIWNNKVITLSPGQFITGRKQLSLDSGISQTTIERILDFLEKERQIGQQKTTKYRLITILNWEIYQISDNKRTTNGQQTDTNKNDKNDKNINTTPKGVRGLVNNKKKMDYIPINDDGEVLVKRRGMKKPVTENPEPFYEDKELNKLLDSPVYVHNIVGFYIHYKKLKYANRDQWEPDLARFMHSAKLLKGWNTKQIEKSFIYCQSKWPKDWTIETAVKYISEANK